MTEPTHTEGPWKTCLPDETLIFGADGNQVATTWQGRDDYDINCERRAADAHLIAAAPDLAEALEAFVEFAESEIIEEGCRGKSDPGCPSCMAIKVVDRARSALAKARGEAS